MIPSHGLDRLRVGTRPTPTGSLRSRNLQGVLQGHPLWVHCGYGDAIEPFDSRDKGVICDSLIPAAQLFNQLTGWFYRLLKICHGWRPQPLDSLSNSINDRLKR